MKTNLPDSKSIDSALATRLYFNNYGTTPATFAANDFSSALGFFESKGFSKDAALSTASVILDQAKADRIPVNQLLDTLKGFDSLELSNLVAVILNNNRPATSTLGFKDINVSVSTQIRNIAP